MEDAESRSHLAVDFLKTQGASVVGISTRETLAGGPPSTHLEYVLPDAQSAVTFAVPFDQEKIEPYLSKQDHGGHQDDNTRTSVFVTGLAVSLASYWQQQGIPSFGCMSNAQYRADTPHGMFDFMPDISHRYLAMPPNRKINFTCGNCQLICHPDRDVFAFAQCSPSGSEMT